MVEANSFVTPFQGWADFRCLYPGRCPGLVCFGLSGQGSAVADFLRTNLQACPAFCGGGHNGRSLLKLNSPFHSSIEQAESLFYGAHLLNSRHTFP